MSDSFQEILKEAKQLTPEERAHLAHELLVSIDDAEDHDAESAWKEIAEQRLASLENGDVEPVGWNQLKDKLG